MWSKHSRLKMEKLESLVTKMAVKQEDGILLVTATCLFDLPSSIVSMTSSGLQTNLSVQPFKEKQKIKWDIWSSQTSFSKCLIVWQEIVPHLDVGYSVFVFMHWQVGLWHWRRKGKCVRRIKLACCGYTTLNFPTSSVDDIWSSQTVFDLNDYHPEISSKIFSHWQSKNQKTSTLKVYKTWNRLATTVHNKYWGTVSLFISLKLITNKFIQSHAKSTSA